MQGSMPGERAGRALLDSDFHIVALYRYVLDGGGEVVDVVFEDVNRAAERAARAGRERLIGHSLGEVFGKGVLDRHLPHIRKTRQTGAPVVFDDVDEDSGPDQDHLTCSYLPVDQEHLVGCGLQAPQHVRPARKVAPDPDLCAEILENVNEAVWVTDGDDRLVYINPAMERLAGAPAAAMLGLSITEDFPPETTIGLEHYLRAKRTRERTPYEADVRVPSGRDTVQAGWLFPRYAGDVFEGMICTVQDLTEQRQAEAALLDSRTRLQTALESMADGLFIVDAGGRLVDINEAWARFCRFDSKAGCLRTFAEYPDLFDVFWPDGTPAPPEEWAATRALRGETRSNDEYVIRRKDTGETWVGAYSYAPVRDRHGAIAGAVVVARDITESRAAALALADSQHRLEYLVQTAPVAITVHGPDGRLLAANPLAERLLGLKEEEGIGKELTDPKWVFFREDGSPMPLEEFPIAKVLTTGTELRDYIVGIDRDDPAGLRWVLVNATPRPADDGSVADIVASFVDVSERRRTEAALRSSEESYRSLFHQMMDGFVTGEIVRDERGRAVDWRFLSANPAFETMTGLRREDVLGRRIREVLPQTEESWVDAYARVVETGEPAVFEGYHRELDRQFSVTSYRTAPGQFAALFLDVTDRKRAEEALRESEEHLRQAQKMEAVGQLAGGIAHDFNNLLAAILGYAHLLLADPALAEPSVHADLQEIRHAAERAAALTQQILAFSRRQTLLPKVVSLNDVITGMEPLIRAAIDESVALAFDLEPEIGNVETDVHQFERVVMNLALNARDAMPHGGTLAISTRNIRLDKRFCLAHPGTKPGDYVELAVADTGEGIDEGDLNRIFDPFFTTKPLGEGSGLGLSVVYGIVKQSNGNVYVESRPGEGTIFRVYLPRKIPVKTVESGGATGGTGPLGSETVLIVEDESAVRSLVARILTKAGYDVLTADTADAALHMVDNDGCTMHLLLTDVVLPGGLQGPELAAELTERCPGLPVLFMSGYALDAMVKAGRLDDTVRLIEKPFSPDAIRQAVRDALDGGAR